MNHPPSIADPAPRDAPWLAAMWSFSLICSVANLHLPWGRDQGIYAHAGTRILDGAAPYADIFVFKPPATVYLHAAAMALFGKDMLAIRLFDIGWTAATAGVLYALVRSAGAPGWAAATAGALFAWQYHDLGYWSSAQTDAWTNLLTGGALALAVAPRGGPLARAFVAGALAGGVLWFKYSLGGLLPLVLLLLVLADPRPPWRAALAGLAGMGASILAVIAMLWGAGAWEPFLMIQRATVLPYTGLAGEGLARRDPWIFLGNLDSLGLVPLAFAGFGFAGVAARLARGPRDAAALAGLAAAGWLAVGLLSAWSQGKFWSYQYQGALGGAAALAGLGLVAVAGWGAQVLAQRSVLLALFLALTYQVPDRLDRVRQLVSGEVRWSAVWGRYGNSGMQVRDNLKVADHLKRTTRPGDRVFVWGYDPMIYVLADRPMVSRFPYSYPMAVAWGPVQAYRDELMTALQADPPVAIVIGRRDRVSVVFGHKKDSEATLADFPELTAFLLENYGPRQEVGRFLVVTRKEAP